MPRPFILIIVLVLLLPPAAHAAGQDMLILYSNDGQGETEPCGCQANQLGGLSKRGAQFKKMAAERARPHLTLDGGDLLFKGEGITPGLAEQEKMAAEAIVEAYNLIGYDAAAVGSRDLSAGVEYLTRLGQKSKFVWLSANLVEKATHKPVFQASVRLKVGEAEAVVIGLTGPTQLPDATGGVTLLPWDEVLPALLAEAAKGDALVILLSNLPAGENRRIAENNSAIHLIIQSRAEAGGAEPELVNNTLITSTAPQGKKIGIMEISWQASKRWGSPPAERLAKAKNALDSLLWQLGKYQRHQEPEAALRDQPDQLKAYRLLVERQQSLQAEIEQLSKEASAGGTPGGSPSSYANRFLALEESLPGQPEIVALFDRLDRAVNQLGRQQATGHEQADSPYLGSIGCGPCHAEQLAAWRKTRHAGAYKTLEAKRQAFNSSCLYCHVTGVSQAEAAQALALPANRRGVGCENCHGPGRSHAKDPKSSAMQRRPAPSVCQACHAPPHDETFDYPTKVKKVH